METAIGLICFALLIVAQIAAVVVVHRAEQQTRDQRESSYRRNPVHGLSLPDPA
jgi:hypothetical protein